jgi:hypothetical protein
MRHRSKGYYLKTGAKYVGKVLWDWLVSPTEEQVAIETISREEMPVQVGDSTSMDDETGLEDEGPRESALWQRTLPILERVKRKIQGRPTSRPTGKVSRCAIRYARIAKAEFGTPDYSPADREAVRFFIRKEMVKNDVRQVDIERHLDFAVALVFLPTERELAAAEVANSRHSKALREELKSLGALGSRV